MIFERTTAESRMIGHYQALIHRMERICGLVPFQLGVIPSTGDAYPFYVFYSQGVANKPSASRFCLSAGIHGDEPASTEALVRFLEATPDIGERGLTIFPCLNPVGYDVGTHENGEGLDLNRLFHVDAPPIEVALVRQAVAGCRYDLFLCCHEDTEASGFYLYEVKKGKGPRLGALTIAKIQQAHSIDQRPHIDGRVNREGMLLPTNWNRRKNGWSMALYMYRAGTSHCVILETATCQDFETRVTIHLEALRHTFALARDTE